ncbi:BlaI/MecI/CopY family transcriptional regulator [Actinomadura rayongensis]|uniref:BlaI/MecI/CopY family transcriptional regulator n=1 Tax=Actinomadura rayongensis TaxID=1429076 RepID=A0A6I4WFT9_9ACTN|nr:BlaI/MecI/CopY family transcriptional regulator [Actinomadura rayongensis]MXQ65854.1 BlaI/MecI/CopY family transcriptional regulator [Actinomadura rayongensis]
MPRRARRAPGELEREVMSLLQQAEDALPPAEVKARLGGDLTYSTVVTILTRMRDKGLLVRLKDGRGYVYTPVADQSGLAALRMREALAAETDRRAVLSQFVGGLSEQEEEILRDLLGPA